MFCSNCGAEVSGNFCSKCGSAVMGAAASSPEIPQDWSGEINYEKLEYDLFYIKKASILMDAKITIATINVIWNQKSL